MEMDEITPTDVKPTLNGTTEYYYNINLNNLCRVCLEKNRPEKEMYNIYDSSRTLLVSHMLMACCSVQVVIK